MKNIEVINHFLRGEVFGKTKNLKNLEGSKLQNYNSIIATKEDNVVVINQNFLHYSKTTSTIINILQREAEKQGIKTLIRSF